MFLGSFFRNGHSDPLNMKKLTAPELPETPTLIHTLPNELGKKFTFIYSCLCSSSTHDVQSTCVFAAVLGAWTGLQLTRPGSLTLGPLLTSFPGSNGTPGFYSFACLPSGGGLHLFTLWQTLPAFLFGNWVVTVLRKENALVSTEQESAFFPEKTSVNLQIKLYVIRTTYSSPIWNDYSLQKIIVYEELGSVASLYRWHQWVMKFPI